MTKIILSTIFQLSPYIEYVNLLLTFSTTHMSSQINGEFNRFAKKKKKKEIVERMMCNTSLMKKKVVNLLLLLKCNEKKGL
jgi:hypothetical protein